MLTKLKVGLISGSALILLAACGGKNQNIITESSDSSSAATNFEGKSFSVTYEQAIADFQEAHPSVAISSIDFDKGFGAYSFEINGFDDTQEIEWEINAENGKETKNNTEKKDADNDDRGINGR